MNPNIWIWTKKILLGLFTLAALTLWTCGFVFLGYLEETTGSTPVGHFLIWVFVYGSFLAWLTRRFGYCVGYHKRDAVETRSPSYR